MKYIVVYGYGESKTFNKKSELFNFIKNECDNIKDKINIHNYFVEINNVIEIHFGRYKQMMMIGISHKEKNQKEKTLELYYDIGKLLGCCSEIIRC